MFMILFPADLIMFLFMCFFLFFRCVFLYLFRPHAPRQGKNLRLISVRKRGTEKRESQNQNFANANREVLDVLRLELQHVILLSRCRKRMRKHLHQLNKSIAIFVNRPDLESVSSNQQASTIARVIPLSL